MPGGSICYEEKQSKGRRWMTIGCSREVFSEKVTFEKGLNKERHRQRRQQVQSGTNKLPLLRNFKKKPVWEVQNEHRKERGWCRRRYRRASCQGTDCTDLVSFRAMPLGIILRNTLEMMGGVFKKLSLDCFTENRLGSGSRSEMRRDPYDSSLSKDWQWLQGESERTQHTPTFLEVKANKTTLLQGLCPSEVMRTTPRLWLQ